MNDALNNAGAETGTGAETGADAEGEAVAPTRGGRLLVGVGILLLAVNLRPAAVSVGPVLDEIRVGLDMSGTEAGVLTSLPVVAFALFGALAPRLASAIGPHRLTAVSLACVVAGLIGRSRVDHVLPFLALSLFALVGMATANVVLPSLVKRHFPDHVGWMTAVYSTGLALGVTSASVLTVPVSEASGGAGGWRSGLAIWSLTALVALVPWLLLSGRDRKHASLGAPRRVALALVARTRTGRRMALFFGLQSMQAYAIFGWFPAIYREAGYSSATAGVLLGVVTGVSIPLSFVVPLLAGRMRDVAPLVWVLGVCYPVGYVGLLIAPSGAWGWAVLTGAATTTFPLVLTMIGLRSRTPEGTASLSAFTQSVGYLIAAVGPFGVGLLRDISGGWTVPLLVLSSLSVPLIAVGLAVMRSAYVEDELESRRHPIP